MIAFILPLKPKAQSKNWEKDCSLLQRTIGSLLNQRNSNYQIFVVYTDEPLIKNTDSKITWVKFPYPFVAFDNIPDASEILPHFSYDKLMLERRWDKSRKIFYGCKQAKEKGCTYFMSVDADDLISNRLVEYVEERLSRDDCPGFYINRGYLLQYGSNRMIRMDDGMQNFNGSTHLLRGDLVPIPDFEKGKWLDYNLFTSHGWVLHRLKESRNVHLEAIPFPAVIYVAHGGNISKVSSRSFVNRIKRWVKLIVRGQQLNKCIRKEFAVQ